jgi:hypothetical protein
MASKQHEYRNNQPKTSYLDERETGWDKRMMGSQGERDSIVLGAIKLGGGGGNLGKIHQFIK